MALHARDEKAGANWLAHAALWERLADEAEKEMRDDEMGVPAPLAARHTVVGPTFQSKNAEMRCAPKPLSLGALSSAEGRGSASYT